jgi:rod shape-determining protein MreC/FtsX extracellular domain
MTDLLDQLRESDPARGRLPDLTFDDVRDRFVVAPRPRSRLVLPIALAAAVALALGIGWSVRRSPSQSIVKAGPTLTTIPASLVAEALALAPESQRKALADGYVSAAEMNRAGAAMAACMTSEGAGPPQQWDELGGGVRLPIKLDDRDDTCERRHTLWLEWAFRVQAQMAVYGDAVASVFMNPDATTEQITAVQGELARQFPDATVRYVDKAGAKDELTTLFPNAPEIAAGTKLEDLPPSFRIATTADLAPLDVIAKMPGVNLVRRALSDLPHPPTGETPQPIVTTSVDKTAPDPDPLLCPQLPSRIAPIVGGRVPAGADSFEIPVGSADAVAVGMPVASNEALVGQVIAVSTNTATVQLLTSKNAAVEVRLTTGPPSLDPTTSNPSETHGTLRGNGAGQPLMGTVVDEGGGIHASDRATTTFNRMSAFPGCIPVGRVVADAATGSTGLGEVRVEPTADPTKLTSVNVIIYRPDTAVAYPVWAPDTGKPGGSSLPPAGSFLEIKDDSGKVTYVIPANRQQEDAADPAASGVHVVHVKVGEEFEETIEIVDAEGIAQVRGRGIYERKIGGGFAGRSLTRPDPAGAVDACKAARWQLKGCISAARLRINPSDRDYPAQMITIDGTAN